MSLHPRDLSHQFLSAVLLLTRIPLPRIDRPAGAAAAWAWPVVGVIVGSALALIAMGLLAVGLPPPIVAALVIGIGLLLTGALHEDGLADCADGFFGGWTPERRLQIMKDSAIGSYGTLALIVVMLVRWSALVPLVYSPAALIAAAVLSRASMGLVAASLPHARKDGLSASVGRPGWPQVITGLVLAAAASLAAVGWTALGAMVATVLTAALCVIVAKAKINGQTGDVLGATQVLTEGTVLCVLVIALAG
jgi:adenosylcobinamide-GDP ribazoletransferase